MTVKQGSASVGRQREIEAAFMPRKPGISGRQAANVALNLPHGAMGDETHWVLEDAMQAVEHVIV